jgi:adenosylcobinamide amidohydrolase
MIAVTMDAPWMDVDLGHETTVLSWAINRPGFVRARHVTWREVRDDDLGPDLDVPLWLADELARTGRSEHVALLTSRALSAVTRCDRTVGAVRATCVATVGLSNGEGVTRPRDARASGWGTINCLVAVDPGLTRAAMIEALSIAAEARTAAVLSAGPAGVTGTGTDCIAVAADEGGTSYAGLHTDTGRAVAGAVHAAILDGVQAWMATEGRRVPHDA